MRRFAQLFVALDSTTSTNEKVDAMAAYFRTAPPADAAWATFFLTGRRLKRLLGWAAIGDFTLAATGLERWLLEECWAAVGDGAETAALVLDQLQAVPATDRGLADWMEGRVLSLRQLDAEGQQAAVLSWLRELDRTGRLVLLKILSGELRLGVSQTLVVRALARTAALPAPAIAARLMGSWPTTADWFTSVLSPETTDVDRSRPYPFCLASPLDVEPAALGDPDDWFVEWKWDGIRAQVVRRAGQVFLWSRGEELITARFPEIVAAASRLDDGTVLDGEVLAFRHDRPLPFSALQQRIGREKQVHQMARAVPVVFMAYDVLELAGDDTRSTPFGDRRRALESLIGEASQVMRLSPAVPARSWAELEALRNTARERNVEGLMLKRRASAYGVGRKRGDWWKWKIAPHTIDAVLIYAQPGSGKRASLLTDYTFGVWDADQLTPIAKAYSGLSNDEIAELDRWIRRHTRARFGPVREVEPVHVFELGFEALAPSSRHRSGVAVRFPRMLRWRKDKAAREADTLATVRGMLQPSPAPEGA
jgi:DNA ligase-1